MPWWLRQRTIVPKAPGAERVTPSGAAPAVKNSDSLFRVAASTKQDTNQPGAKQEYGGRLRNRPSAHLDDETGAATRAAPYRAEIAGQTPAAHQDFQVGPAPSSISPLSANAP